MDVANPSGNYLMKPVHLSRIPPSDRKYFFRRELEESVAVTRSQSIQDDVGNLSVGDISELLRDVSGANERKVVVGAKVYDDEAGRTKYEVKVLRGPQRIRSNPLVYGVDLIPSFKQAREIEREVLVKMARDRIAGDVRTRLVGFENYGFVVIAEIFPDSARDIREIDRKIVAFRREIGVAPSRVE